MALSLEEFIRMHKVHQINDRLLTDDGEFICDVCKKCNRVLENSFVMAYAHVAPVYCICDKKKWVTPKLDVR